MDVEVDLVRQPAGNATLAELALGIEALVRIEFVRIARQVGVVADGLRRVGFAGRTRPGNDRLQFDDFAVLEGVGGLSRLSGFIPRRAAAPALKRSKVREFASCRNLPSRAAEHAKVIRCQRPI
jgi:hypothetical protein